MARDFREALPFLVSSSTTFAPQGRRVMTCLAGKNALITGGATGIGWGIAAALAAAGCRVAIAGRREDKLREAAASWTGDPPMLTQGVDVADRARD
jgi:short-subunit dehydrogenase involved in D-alanine esterification of teichoic acids